MRESNCFPQLKYFVIIYVIGFFNVMTLIADWNTALEVASELLNFGTSNPNPYSQVLTLATNYPTMC